MKKSLLLFILFVTTNVNIFSNNSEVEELIFKIVDSYERRIRTDLDTRYNEFVFGLKHHETEMGLTSQQMTDSIASALKTIEPDTKNWPKRVTEETDRIKSKTFLIVLYVLSIRGNADAIGAMKEIFYSKKNKRLSKFAAETLFKSSAAWYPVAEHIVDSGYSSLRYLLYASYLKNYVLVKNNTDETKDSVAQIVCRGMLKEIEPTHLIYADTLLTELYKEEYRFCIERLYVLKKGIENKDYQEFLKQHKAQKNYFKRAKEIISNVLQTKEKYSSPRFRKYFNIAEDLDTVDIHFDEND